MCVLCCPSAFVDTFRTGKDRRGFRAQLINDFCSGQRFVDPDADHLPGKGVGAPQDIVERDWIQRRGHRRLWVRIYMSSRRGAWVHAWVQLFGGVGRTAMIHAWIRSRIGRRLHSISILRVVRLEQCLHLRYRHANPYRQSSSSLHIRTITHRVSPPMLSRSPAWVHFCGAPPRRRNHVRGARRFHTSACCHHT